MKSIRRLGATLGLATALLVSSAGVASAQSWSLADPVGDVVTIHEDNSVSYAPSRAQGDVVRTTVSHTRTTLVVRLRMRALPRGDWSAFAVVRTPSTSFDLTQVKIGGTRGFVLTKTNGGKVVRCAGKSARFDRTALVLTVPRSCLGKPRTVRVGAGVALFEGESVVHGDDALRRALGEDLRLSPPIRRG
ncbi:hypothetical protein [Nocardioides sp. LML1-1-1.1]|uniref:hypothetical protein n=1 Tax=Nocardioides sp. LML1-1-1.1 TaxID=3135248 RepID=UPI0034152124